MKAVFLDAGTFSVATHAPSGVSAWQSYETTPADTALLIARCHDADIIITNKVPIGAELIHTLPKLKLIHVAATGTNNIDKAAAAARAIPVMNVAGYSDVSVPEHSLMLMLSAMRAGHYYHTRVGDGTWQEDGRFCLMDVPILDLAGCSLGIIGAGLIGRRVGELARAFGMQVYYAERAGRAPRNADYTDFDQVLACADVISLHCTLTDETHHLVNDAFIDKLGKKALIVNAARGAVVDGEALVRALQADKILGYASDVFEEEPPAPNSPLLGIKDHPRVIYTPHNAWASSGAQMRLWQILSEQVSDFIKYYQA